MEPMLSHADYAVSHLAESVCFLLHTYKGNWGLCHWALNHWGTWALGHWGIGGRVRTQERGQCQEKGHGTVQY